VNLYHHQLSSSGYTIYQLARTNSRGDGKILYFLSCFLLVLIEYGLCPESLES